MTENPHIENIFSAEEEECLDLGQMKAYSKGTLVGEEKHYVERHLLNCELCAMAIEGIAELPVSEVEAGQAAISQAAWDVVGARERKRRRGAFIWLSAAAAVILLVTVTWISIDRPQDNFEEIFTEEYRAPKAGEDQALAAARDDKPGDGSGVDNATTRRSADQEQQLDRKVLEKLNKDKGPLTATLEDAEVPAEEFAVVEEEPMMEEEAEMDDFVVEEVPVGGAEKLDDQRFADRPAQPIVTQPKSVAGDGFLNQTPATTGSVAPSMAGNTTKNISTKDISSGKLGGGIDHADDDLDFAAGADEAEETEIALDEVVISGTVPERKLERTMSATTITSSDVVEVQGATNRRNKSKGKRGAKAKAAPKKSREENRAYKEDAKEDVLAESEKPADANKPAAQATTFDQGMDAYNDGKYQNAAALLRQAAAETPANLQAHFYAAAAFLNINQPQAAIYHLDRILAQPENSLTEDAQWYKSLAYVKLKERDKARQSLEKVVKKDGKYRKRASKVLKDL